MKNNKIGILTLCSAQNYGAVLQCHSLCKYINDNFGKAEIIRFTPKFIIGRYPVFVFKGSTIKDVLKSLLSNAINAPVRKRKYNRFDDFRNESFFYGEKRYIETMTDDQYDLYVVGSDQVFNLDLTQYDEEFFLPHISKDKMKISYAASIGVSSLTEKQEMILRNGLKDFDYISIREEVGCSLIREILPLRKIERFIDPVFLNSKDYWMSLCAKRQHKREYILIYAFNEFEKAYTIAKYISKDLDILSIDDSFRKKKEDVYNMRGVGPREFLSLIKHANVVLTDSFHGTAFSIIFNKNFYSIPYKGTESRFTDMLTLFDLNKRIVNESNAIDYSEINYTFVEERIQFQKNRTNEYFKNLF